MIRAIIAGAILLLVQASASAQGCGDTPIAVQILGSGGPVLPPLVPRQATSFGSMVGQEYLSIWEAGLTNGSANHKRNSKICGWSASAIFIPITFPTCLHSFGLAMRSARSR